MSQLMEEKEDMQNELFEQFPEEEFDIENELEDFVLENRKEEYTMPREESMKIYKSQPQPQTVEEQKEEEE